MTVKYYYCCKHYTENRNSHQNQSIMSNYNNNKLKTCDSNKLNYNKLSTITNILSSTNIRSENQIKKLLLNLNSELFQEYLNNNDCNNSLDVMDDGGMTLLHRSVLANRLEIVRLLIQNGANVNLANRDGWSPLHLAAHNGYSDILSYLLKL